MEKPNVVVIGYGFAGRCFHAYLVGLADGLNLYGIATSRAEARTEIERDLGVKTFDNFDAVLADPAVDLVVLATPNDLHAPHAIQAMQAGKHVVTDKPMCLSLAEADQMIAASQQHDRLLSVFQNRRWDGDFLMVKKLIADGRLGHPFMFELFWGQYGKPRGWRSEAAHGGGKFYDLGAHMIDQALQLVDSPLEQVYASFHSGAVLDLDVEAHALAVYRFANGVEARVETSSLACQPKPRWYVLGTEGAVVKTGLDPQEKAMIAGDIDSATEAPENYARLYGPEEETIIEPIPGRWRSYYENIADALTGRAELAVTAQSVRQTLVAIEAARLSAAERRVVTPSEIA
jgi:scyllo-inositol 2-dehydrogenase (NADP+)